MSKIFNCYSCVFLKNHVFTALKTCNKERVIQIAVGWAISEDEAIIVKP